MNRHPIDSTALIFGLLFALAGMAILIDETVPEVDATLVTGTVVGALGIAFVATLVTRQVRVTSGGAHVMVDERTFDEPAPTDVVEQPAADEVDEPIATDAEPDPSTQD